MSTAVIGSVYHTAQTNPQSGVYRLVSCTEVSPAQYEIPLSKGETFPPCRSCRGAARWKLVRLA
jgi:hypothetical protein